MKHIFKALMCIAAVTMMTACGSGENKKESDADKAGKEIMEELGIDIKETVTENWPSNEYTKQVPEPDIDIKVSGTAKLGDNEVFSTTFADGTTKEQIKGYVEKLKSAGFTIEASESGADEYYMFNAKNNTGYDVLVSWASSAAGMMIGKE